MSLREKVKSFGRAKRRNHKVCGKKPNVDQVRKKFGIKTWCAYSGIPIDLEDTKNFSLDHIKPVCRGGSRDLDNMQVVTKKINIMKGSLHEEDFLYLVKRIYLFRIKKENPFSILKDFDRWIKWEIVSRAQ